MIMLTLHVTNAATSQFAHDSVDSAKSDQLINCLVKSLFRKFAFLRIY